MSQPLLPRPVHLVTAISWPYDGLGVLPPGIDPAALTAELLVVGDGPHRTLGFTTHAVLHETPCPMAVVPLARGGER